MAPTGIDQIEIKVGTYRAHLDVNASMDMKRAKHVVTAWKGGLFRGATLATRDASSKRWEPISLASVLTMFDVKTSKAMASAPATEVPADPIAEIADRREMEIAREVEAEFRNELGEFDRIVMNPPFERGADVDHIRHAWQFLKPGGRLVALCADGTRQRETLKPWAEELGGTYESLPPGTFKEQGTSVNVALIVVDAPAAESAVA